MAKKALCKNIRCKHHNGSSKCSGNMKIGYDGKCTAFEKGFPYYLFLVWDSLQHKNYIDMVEINQNPDLRIGIYYACRLYHLRFSEAEWGSCRFIHLHDMESEASLKYEDFKDREVDEKVFDELFTDFMAGNLPNHSFQKPKKNSQPFGWVSSCGDFIEAGHGDHDQIAEEIVYNKHYAEEYSAWIEKKPQMTHREFLIEVKGYCLIHNPLGDGGYLVSYKKPLTKRQRDFLYGYFADMGDMFKAKRYLGNE